MVRCKPCAARAPCGPRVCWPASKPRTGSPVASRSSSRRWLWIWVASRKRVLPWMCGPQRGLSPARANAWWAAFIPTTTRPRSRTWAASALAKATAADCCCAKPRCRIRVRWSWWSPPPTAQVTRSRLPARCMSPAKVSSGSAAITTTALICCPRRKTTSPARPPAFRSVCPFVWRLPW